MKSRSGFTLIELLVALAIISLLLGLTLPAIQSVREVSRRSTCASRMRQLGVACQSFEATHQHFPEYNHQQSVNAGNIPGSHAVILDHLGYAALNSQLDWHAQSGSPRDEPPSVGWPGDAWKTAIPDFVCPSDSTPPGGNNFRASEGTETGDSVTWSPRWNTPRPSDTFNEALFGILPVGARAALITDGLSQTVLYSERIVGDGDTTRFTPGRDIAGIQATSFRWPNDGIIGCSGMTIPVTTFSYSGWTWALGSKTHVEFNHVATPNTPIPDCVSAPAGFVPTALGVYSARSWHPGGVNIVLADGATRFVSDSIDLRVWRGLGTMYGAEVLSGSDF